MDNQLIDMFFLMIRRPPRSTPKPSSAASDVYKRQLKIVSYMPNIQTGRCNMLAKSRYVRAIS
ncbi:hypothetical protein AMBR_BLFENHAL_02864 [Lacticaseibacillus rhamnosus]|nr:hypothetical protein AMBR_BLFENHAL_02864 [Lacticaseibacillus rhamnosus]